MEPSGEVLYGFLNKWIAQSWHWEKFPSFGSIVVATYEPFTVVGIVTDIQTGSFDNTRTPFAYQQPLSVLEKEQPQIFSFLTTQYTCITLGYIENNIIKYQLPPEPIKIHSLVSTAPQKIIANFFSCHRYLPLIFSYNHTTTIDELLLALIQQLQNNHLATDEYIELLVESIYNYLGNDYHRLKLLIYRIESKNSRV